jgi:hypothetical protein
MSGEVVDLVDLVPPQPLARNRPAIARIDDDKKSLMRRFSLEM